MTPLQACPPCRPAARALPFFLGLAVATWVQAGPAPDASAVTAPQAQNQPQYHSQHLAVSLEQTHPAFCWFSVDPAGNGRLDRNLALPGGGPPGAYTLENTGAGQYRYLLHSAGGPPSVAWEVVVGERSLTLTSEFTPGVDVPALRLLLDPHACAASLPHVGIGPAEIHPPVLLSLPSNGAVRITTSSPDLVLECDASPAAPRSYFEVDFPAASEKQPIAEYTLDLLPAR